MSTLNLPPIQAGELEASAVFSDGSMQIQLRGNADMRSVTALSRWLRELHREATRLGIAQAVVDVRTLEFMSSSCFRGLVSWIGEVQESQEERQYRIKFLSDPRLLWQRRNLHALSCFAVDLITIETSSG
jgi:anti-anti-sigma factor